MTNNYNDTKQETCETHDIKYPSLLNCPLPSLLPSSLPFKRSDPRAIPLPPSLSSTVPSLTWSKPPLPALFFFSRIYIYIYMYTRLHTKQNMWKRYIYRETNRYNSCEPLVYTHTRLHIRQYSVETKVLYVVIEYPVVCFVYPVRTQNEFPYSIYFVILEHDLQVSVDGSLYTFLTYYWKPQIKDILFPTKPHDE